MYEKNNLLQQTPPGSVVASSQAHSPKRFEKQAALGRFLQLGCATGSQSCAVCSNSKQRAVLALPQSLNCSKYS